jgi:hypothetical protein
MPVIARLRQEEGVALFLVAMVLAVLLLISAVAFSSSLRVKTSTQQGRYEQKALAAAETGLRVATSSLNQSKTAAGESIPVGLCPPTGAAPPTAPWCAAVTNSTSVGDGSSYTYSVSTKISAATPAVPPCVGAPVIPPRTTLNLAERCITATGTHNGVTRRVQARVASVDSFDFFPVAGIAGLDHVCIGCNPGTAPGGACSQAKPTGGLANQMVGSIGSNGAVTVDVNNGQWSPPDSDVELGVGLDGSPNTCPRLYKGQSPPAGEKQASHFPQIDVTPNFENPYATGLAVPAGCGLARDASLCNVNATGLVSAGGQPSSCASISPTTYDFSVGGGCTVYLKDGAYRFCTLTLGNNATVLPYTGAGASIEMFLDSRWRTTASDGTTLSKPCPASPGPGAPLSGTTSMGNGAVWMNTGNPATSATVKGDQLYAYGNPADPGSSPVLLANNNKAAMVLFAPNSVVQIANSNATTSGAVTGGILAWAVEFGNNDSFVWDKNVDSIGVGAANHVFSRVAWQQCQGGTKETDPPGTGC